jgi:uncharacterized membrane protein
MVALLFLFLVFAGLGILAVLISLPLINEKVKPNPFYGFRVRATLENEKIWYAANKYFARRLLLAGVVEIIVAIALFIVPNIGVDVYVLGVLGVFAVAFTIGMIQSFNYLKSIRRESNDSAEPHI